MSGVTKKLMSAAGGVAGGEFTAIEDVFSTYLYTGNGSTQTITNDIDLAGEGGLVWLKTRSSVFSHRLIDTEVGLTKARATNGADADLTYNPSFPWISSFDADGFTLGDNAQTNFSGTTYASWTFRKAPRFFDVVTYTGDGVAGRTIPHNLGAEPGFIVVKITSASDNWECYHRGVTFNAGNVLWLNSTNALTTGVPRFSSAPDNDNFYVGSDSGVNGSGQTYVAYLFAHDPLGPSGDGSDGLIDCGSYTGNGSTDGPEIDLGWEPQWLLIKVATGTTDQWVIFDTMRGLVTGGDDNRLFPNLSNSELIGNDYVEVNSRGFKPTLGTDLVNRNTSDYIYIAIRRGPMRAPTSGTEVFAPAVQGVSGANPTYPTGFVTDFSLTTQLFVADKKVMTRLLGATELVASDTSPEGPYINAVWDYMNGWGNETNQTDKYSWGFRRAPEFFDVVAYTGDGVQGHNVSHNLGVAPDMMIVKQRSTTFIDGEWQVYVSGITHLSVYGSDPDNYGDNPVALRLDSTNSANFSKSGNWDHTHPTDTFFRLGDTYHTNRNGDTYIAYLFATLAGVSKVFSVTKSSGSNADVNCGFTSGPRFVLLKRTDAAGDWYVWDTARGIVAGNDPYLLLNSTAAEVTSTDYIDPTGNGFTIVDGGLANGDYIGLAIS